MTLELSVRVRGENEKPSVVFLHAFPLDSTMYDAEVSALEGVAKTFAIDLRGFGESGPGALPSTFEHLVEDVERSLAKHGVERAAFVGVSMGGYLALRLAERSPEKVSGLFLAGTHPNPDSDEQKLKRAATIDSLEDGNLDRYADAFLGVALSETTQKTQPEVARLAKSIITRQSRLALASTLVALATRTDTNAVLGKLRVPTFVVAGGKDRIVPLDVMRAMSSAIEGAKLHILPEAGHLVNLEAGAAFGELLRAFVLRLEA